MNGQAFWFLTGSQFLYGEETLQKVGENSAAIAAHLNGSLPYPVVCKGVMKTAEEIENAVREANYDKNCAGVIVFCHTFSPSKMWIGGLGLLQKPYLHFHTQFREEIPNKEIDMDYMNLHQSAHGDREHGFIGARMAVARKIVVGHWQSKTALAKIAKWQRTAIAAAFSRALKVVRFGDNMREVAVTEGDKVEAQIRFGWQVNTIPVGTLAAYADAVTEAQISEKYAEYLSRYDVRTDDTDSIKEQAREEIAMRKILEEYGAMAFTNTFEDLYGLRQLPGLATQNLMADGYGYGGEGDWKTAAMTAIIKTMGTASFMEDYTYDLKRGYVLGAHMLEVCPTIAADKPRIEVHPLGIGGKNPPARLVFEGQTGSATASSLIDLGSRFRLIVQDVECIKPLDSYPNLPVARVMWKPLPDLETAAECWLHAGGAHHTTLSYDADAYMLRDFARIMDVEFTHIGKNTNPFAFEEALCTKR